MSTVATFPRRSKAPVIIGWVLGVIPCALLSLSAVMKFLKPPEVLEGFAQLGWGESAAVTLGVLEVACTLLYLFPPTAVLGAILLTGYLGGAVATHLRVDDPLLRCLMPVLLGVVLWVGIALRDPRLWSLVPWRRRG